MPYARISKNGYSQEVRLPKEFRMPGTRVKITRYGKGLLIEPVEDGFYDLFESLSMFSDDFMEEGRQQSNYKSAHMRKACFSGCLAQEAGLTYTEMSHPDPIDDKSPIGSHRKV